MRWRAAFVGALLLVRCVVGGDTLPSSPAVPQLRAALGDAVRYTAKPGPTLRYCPDNTCEVFRSQRADAGVLVGDFALLYLWGVSDYIYLSEWRRQTPPARVTALLASERESCPTRALDCVLRQLQRRRAVEVAFGRYDEGGYTEERINLKEQLAKRGK